MESVEASGKSIEDAILQALARLGRNRDEVEITVLQQPSRGQRGMGVRDARVRVFVKAAFAGGRPGAVVTPEMAGALLPGDEGEAGEEPFYDDEGSDDEPYAADDEQAGYEGDEEEGEPGSEPQIVATTAALRDLLPEDASIEEVAIVALETMLAHMGVRAIVEPRPAENDEDPLILDIRPLGSGSLSLLIGRRGETLSAIQLLLNLVVNKQTDQRERIIVDIEGYRGRREDNLRSMAYRIAQQVRQSGRPIMLEAMPPAERRIIHMTLAESDDIATESTGEGDQRRVVVSLKRGAR